MSKREASRKRQPYTHPAMDSVERIALRDVISRTTMCCIARGFPLAFLLAVCHALYLIEMYMIRTKSFSCAKTVGVCVLPSTRRGNVSTSLIMMVIRRSGSPADTCLPNTLGGFRTWNQQKSERMKTLLKHRQ